MRGIAFTSLDLCAEAEVEDDGQVPNDRPPVCTCMRTSRLVSVPLPLNGHCPVC